MTRQIRGQLTKFSVHGHVRLLGIHARNVVHVLELVFDLIRKVIVDHGLSIMLGDSDLLLLWHMKRVFVRLSAYVTRHITTLHAV